MTTLILSSAPAITTETIALDYVIDKGEKGHEAVSVMMTRKDRTSYLPVRQRDAVAAATIYDACAEYVGQEIRAALAGYRSALSVWNLRLKTLIERGKNGQAGELLRHLRNKPVKPDLPVAVAEQIAPFVTFLTMMRAGWSGAKKHVLHVYGSGKLGKSVIWTGTLSSLTGKTPTSGIIAKGRKIR